MEISGAGILGQSVINASLSSGRILSPGVAKAFRGQ